VGALRRALLAGLLFLAPLAAAAELVHVEAIGSVPLGAASSGGAAARQRAVEAGVRDAVERTAAEMAREAGTQADAEAVRAAIGDPMTLAASYKILEDRGERAPLLEASPGAEREYVVAVEVEVDRSGIRSRLAKAGILPQAAASAPSGGVRRIVFEGVDSWALWTRIRQVLGARGGSVQALEFAPGRVVAEIGAPEPEGPLLARLGAGLGESFEIAPLGADGDALRVAVTRRPAPELEAGLPETAPPEAPVAPAPR